jgi:hypothetical protein
MFVVALRLPHSLILFSGDYLRYDGKEVSPFFTILSMQLQASFWMTLCDLEVVFGASDILKVSMQKFLENVRFAFAYQEQSLNSLQQVCTTMNNFGNFRESVSTISPDEEAN